ncbi:MULTISPECIES: hypothetical protein [Methylobacterium]|uniref:Uncharacterized protein n=1 Tax=Methylobacterium isbiliense TaxID=315478 RepID=A0ABQ4S6P8_9HYPH|nr:MULTISPECIES: hypothetical protein [Methylobacterium]MBY0295648.1 hypothetical protein [Methylobacterium sp.]MDN3622929.1 hypothetical protein [Methylobacterium isbiliense]GJD98799.1 hypothetical protein GMJLKIPL_0711 [Methylobacterium isbiliense]
MTRNGLLGALILCAAATLAVWLLVMPDEPARALQDGAGAAALATLLVGVAIRRGAE